MTSHPSACALVIASFTLISCGSGAVAQNIRPNAPTAATALGEAPCHEVDKHGEPLVVDWRSEQRGDLEIAMKEGVAVVEYSCKGIRLLKDCHIEGQYGFIGMTRREQLVRLENADEVRANLPLSGATLGGEVNSGSTLDIAMVMVGKRRTTWENPTRADLQGACDGATHFVRGALVGAFVMEQGSRANVRAAAEILGVGAGAASSSAEKTRNQDGDPSDCKKATPASATAPDQCGAPIRLVLSAIATGAPPAAESAEAEAKTPVAAVEEPCPQGLVFTDGKCTASGGDKPFQCNPGNPEECTAQCDKGHVGSCATLAGMVASGSGVERDLTKAVALFKKACDGGDSHGCVGLGVLTAEGSGTAKDPAAAAGLFDKACNDGDADGCGRLAAAAVAGDGVAKDASRAIALYQQACQGGHVRSCGEAGTMLVSGSGGAADLAKAADYLKRACDGGHPASCNALGELIETGRGVRRDPIWASMMYRRGCMFASGDGCMNLGRLQLGGSPGAGQAQEAKQSFDRACMLRSELGCATLKAVYGEQKSWIPNVMRAQELRRGCDTGQARDCGLTAILTLAQGIKPMAMNDLQRACTMGDGFACAVQKMVR